MRVRLRTTRHAIDIVDGRIAALHTGAPDVDVDLGDAQLLPGLINAHDHLHRNHYPRLGTPPYPNAYAWGDDLHARYRDQLTEAATLPRRDALVFGAFKNLIGGATTVVHHDRWEASFDDGFPVRVPRLGWSDGLGRPGAGERVPDDAAPFSMHLAEGTDPAAAEEVRCVDAAGWLDERLLAVHLVGADPDGIARLARARVALVWCPTSNRFLYGRTMPTALFESRLDVLIGTDALVSGEGTLLDELHAARTFGVLSEDQLRAAVGATAARRLGLHAPSLTPGSPADIVALRQPLGVATPRDVALVLVRGQPAVADESLRVLFEVAEIASDPMCIGGEPKQVAAPLAAAARRAIALTPSCGRILQ